MIFKKTKRAILLFTFTGLFLIGISSAMAQSQNPVDVGFFEQYSVAPGNSLDVPFQIRGVTGLYAVDLSMQFDPLLLQVEDTDPTRVGVQISLGLFLDPGLVLTNEVNNEKGTIRFVMTQANPSESKDGSGIVLVIRFLGVKEGTSAITINNLMLATRDGNEIPINVYNTSIKVDNNAADMSQTQLPIQGVAGMLQIPTEISVPEARATQLSATQTAFALVPTPTITPQNINVQATSATVKPDKDPARFSLERSWWIILVLALIVIGMAAFWYVTRKRLKVG